MITSPNNPRFKEICALMTRRKARLSAHRCVLEGARLVSDVLDAGTTRPDYALFTADFAASKLGAALLSRLGTTRVACLEVAPDLATAMAGTETPPGIWAVCPQPAQSMPPDPSLALVLDGLRDPGNLGTLIRTAGAAGVDVVALLKGTVDPFNPKALRAGMGAHFRVPIASVSWDTLPPLSLVLAEALGQTRYDAFDWTQPVALVIGGEAHGFSDEARRRAGASVSIPMAHQTESLNVAAAAAVILFEARRQRRTTQS